MRNRSVFEAVLLAALSIRVLTRRAQLRLSQQALADAARVDRKVISRIETRDAMPTAATIAAIAPVLRMRVSKLLGVP
jgi:transcriptional regulator with XRE-family HTH domain